RSEAYEFHDADVSETVIRAVDVCRPRAERQEIALEVEMTGAGSSQCCVDERALEIALINLIDNALKYAPRGKVIRIVLRSDSDKLELKVEDQGPGIEPDQKKKIFERFVRGNVTGDRARGSGIGLSL